MKRQRASEYVVFLEVWLLESGVRLLRSAARHPRHVAASLTAIAVPVTTWVLLSVLLEDTGVPGEVGAVAMLLPVVLGVVIGVNSERLGRGSHTWRDWTVVILVASLGLVVVLGFVVFFALFGTLLGLYVVAAAFGAWLALRLTIAVSRMVRVRRQHPT